MPCAIPARSILSRNVTFVLISEEYSICQRKTSPYHGSLDDDDHRQTLLFFFLSIYLFLYSQQRAHLTTILITVSLQPDNHPLQSTSVWLSVKQTENIEINRPGPESAVTPSITLNRIG